MKYDYQVDMSTDNSQSLILRRVRPCSQVLELGPATGYMTRYMHENLNSRVFAVEINAEAATRVTVYAEKVIVADIDNFTWRQELEGITFDHILFADVLEHLRSPSKVLRWSTELLNPGGTIITSIPNLAHNAVIMNLMKGVFEYKEVGLLDNTHIHFFTGKSIIELLDEAGLCAIEWLTTEALPEHTEFQQQYSDFPSSIVKALLNRPNAHTYQFITVSQLKREVTDTGLHDSLTAKFNNQSSFKSIWSDVEQLETEYVRSIKEETLLRQLLSKREQELHTILSSKGWSYLRKLYKIRDLILRK